MKPSRCIAFTLLAVFLTAWCATAHEPLAGKGPFNARHLNIMQEELNLTDEQNTAVQEILAGDKQTMAEIFENHGLQGGDMRMMHRQLKKFRPQGLGRLKTVLDQEQFLALCNEVFKDNPLEFIQLPATEKLGHLQDFLWMSEKEASQVTAILEDIKVEHRQALENLGFSPEEMMAFHQDMATHHEEMNNSLSEILSGEQMAKFAELRSWMKHRNRGHGPKGEQL